MVGKCYIGIDPGQKGFISVQFNGAWEHFSIEDNDSHQLAKILRQIKEKHPNLTCVMESVHAIFGSSAKSTFNFGQINGLLLGLLIANEIPYSLVPPKTWQAEMWIDQDKEITYKKEKHKNGKEVVKKEINTKPTSINCCKRLFPSFDLRRTTKCTNIDDNKVDSILICEYARRMNL